MSTMKIYVDLPDEMVAVWCPVEAIHLKGDVYQIVEVNSDPEDTRWPFPTGAKVRCKQVLTRDEPRTAILVAWEKNLRLIHH